MHFASTLAVLPNLIVLHIITTCVPKPLGIDDVTPGRVVHLASPLLGVCCFQYLPQQILGDDTLGSGRATLR